ncbi:Mycothiol acetyltransferase [Defluviimonas aquaemixtae]|uniref:Mycothiol acetyltransferase n=1 Tax=Albidovulum aquaemixtae TaxID=1542388 RepID=A0A2R8BNI0_9RHOB|nr:GNAT family N-acetyltransferase [Defluviimonas aquaemixtae]SPH24989.1 Mycothiol acetyltransferase [Defluviimonas aquaemixtae]
MIRRLGPGDAALWRAIRLEALATAPLAFSAQLADWETRPIEDFAAQIADNPIFLAFEGERPVGSITWTRDRDPVFPTRAWVEGVFVSPVMRQRGVGRALMDVAMAAARRAGMREMWLEVGAANAAARAAYARAGFAEVLGPDRPSPSRGACEISMWRALT